MGQKREVITSEVGIISRHNSHAKSATLKDWPCGCTISSKLCPVKWGSGHVGATNSASWGGIESPQPPPWGKRRTLLGASPSDPSRARRARIRKLLMVTKLDLSSLHRGSVTIVIFVLLHFPIPSALSPYSWYSLLLSSRL